jgi:hypothetical protein
MDNRDGTYDVKFDDGDRDRAVPKRSIKKAGGGGDPSFGGRSDEDAPVKLREGDKVPFCSHLRPRPFVSRL